MSDRELIEKTKSLSPDDLEKVLELWFKATQGNKDETSGLHAELRRMIKDLDTKVDNFITRSEPFVAFAEKMTWLKKASVGFVLTTGAVIAAIAGISTYGSKIFHDILGR